MRIKGKKKRVKVKLREKSYEELLHDFIEKVITLKRRDYHSTLEPFEVYAEKLRLEMKDYFQDFHERFLHGYNVLIKERYKR